MTKREIELLHETAKGLFETFINRLNAFATQLDDGRYFASYKAITVEHVMEHLKGDITLAVYLLNWEGLAKYSVLDADDEEGFEKLVKVHENFPLPSYLESSRRGGHLWFFIEEPIVGKIAKNFGLEIAKKFLIEAEVFPKQSESEGVGSGIRLPFGIHRKTGERYPFIGLGNWREQLDALTHPQRIPVDEIMKYQCQEPERKKTNLTVQGVGEMGDLSLWEKVKRQITLRELAEQYVDLNAKGVGKCPFHDDTVPSFSVNDKEKYWICFAGCGGGSVIDFWMKLNNMDFGEALYDLAEKFGVS